MNPEGSLSTQTNNFTRCFDGNDLDFSPFRQRVSLSNPKHSNVLLLTNEENYCPSYQNTGTSSNYKVGECSFSNHHKSSSYDHQHFIRPHYQQTVQSSSIQQDHKNMHQHPYSISRISNPPQMYNDNDSRSIQPTSRYRLLHSHTSSNSLTEIEMSRSMYSMNPYISRAKNIASPLNTPPLMSLSSLHNSSTASNSQVNSSNNLFQKKFNKKIVQPLTNEILRMPEELLACSYDEIESEDYDRFGSSNLCQWEGCFQEFFTMSDMIAHITNEHVGSRKKSYICCWKDCTRNKEPFFKLHKITSHIRTHTGEKPYLCLTCNRRFPRLDSLNSHSLTHFQSKMVECPIKGCLKKYYHVRGLRKHLSLAHPQNDTNEM